MQRAWLQQQSGVPESQVIITHATQESTFHPIQPLKIPGQRENTMRNRGKEWEGRHLRKDLSRDDLLFLLSMLEGELQVRGTVDIQHAFYSVCGRNRQVS